MGGVYQRSEIVCYFFEKDLIDVKLIEIKMRNFAYRKIQ